MSAIVKFIKRETVLCIAFAAALISMIFVPPNADYLGYVDWSTLGLLFCLMAAVQGFGSIGAFRKLSGVLTRRFRNTRTLGAALSLMCFFLAMLVTNDVSLITLVPLTITLFRCRPEVTIRTVVLETAAANLGSMTTPMGNPQNLYIYSHYQMPLGEFFRTMLPPTVISLVIIALSALLIPSQELEPAIRESASGSRSGKLRVVLYSVAAAASLCTVVRLLDWRISLVITLACVLIADRRVLARVDYALLGTFVCFFVFVGNISAIPAVKGFISGIVTGRELLVGAALSQVISNVPCAVMLSGFTENAGQLMLGVDIGGLGTLIASLASLISFKLYCASEEARKGRYFLEFTIYNFAVLAVLLAAQWGINGIIQNA